VNLYSLFVYIEHNGDESPKEYQNVLKRANLGGKIRQKQHSAQEFGNLPAHQQPVYKFSPRTYTSTPFYQFASQVPILAPSSPLANQWPNPVPLVGYRRFRIFSNAQNVTRAVCAVAVAS